MGLNNPNLTGSFSSDKKNGASEKGAKKDRCSFRVPADSKKKLDDTIKGTIVRASEIASDISEFFSGIFSDFAGCWIEPYAQGNGFDVKLYFNPAQRNGIGQMCAFEQDLGDNVKSDSEIYRTIKQMEQLPTKRLFKLTDDAEEGLSDYYTKYFKNNNGIPLWSQGLCYEESMNGNHNNGVYVVIRCLDLELLCKEIYADVDPDDGSRLEYQFTPIPVNIMPMQYGGVNYGNDCAIFIQTTSRKKAEKAGRAVGIINSFGIPMVGRR